MTVPSRPQRIPGPLSLDFLISKGTNHLARVREDVVSHGQLRPAARPPAHAPSVQIMDEAISDIEHYSALLDPVEIELARVFALDELRRRLPDYHRFMFILSPGAFECWGAAYATCLILNPSGAALLEAADGSAAHGYHYRWAGQPYELDKVNAHAPGPGSYGAQAYAWPDGSAPSAQARIAYGVFRSKGEPISAALDLAREVVAPRRLSSSPASDSPEPSGLLAP